MEPRATSEASSRIWRIGWLGRRKPADRSLLADLRAGHRPPHGAARDGKTLLCRISLVGVGNALTRNPALRRAVERRFGMRCEIPSISEMAAYGAALSAGRD